MAWYVNSCGQGATGSIDLSTINSVAFGREGWPKPALGVLLREMVEVRRDEQLATARAVLERPRRKRKN